MIDPDWIWGLFGGLMIGLAGALLLLGAGRVMGASGILGGLVDGTGRAMWDSRLLFLVGVVLGPLLIGGFGSIPATHVTSNVFLLISAGLLVGYGTRMANGCTSGHGVCGISRFSVRGIVATLIYIGAGIIAMGVFRHILGWV